jgi:hypothetical protein
VRRTSSPLAGAERDPFTPDSLELAARLAGLPVRIEQVTVTTGGVPAAGYPDGPRPTGVVRLEGEGRGGHGECVAWTKAEQERFAAFGRGAALPARGRVAEFVSALRTATADAYQRAALEAAVLDLALRQAGTNLFELSGVAPRPVRFAVSFDSSGDPLPVLQSFLETSPGARIKLDIEPDWTDQTLEGLAALESVVVLDLKLRGDLRTAERVHAAMPNALVEDPRLDERPRARSGEEPPPVRRAYAAGATPAEIVGAAAGRASAGLRARASFDGPILSAGDVTALPLVPAAINVKPARMGGFFEALRAIAACRGAGISTYVGGMFEVGPGRSQVQVLASLFSPGAWNDVAPIPAALDAARLASTLAVPADFIGLGFDAGRS